MFRYGVRAQLGNVAWALGSRVDQLALSVLVSSRDLGVYAAAASYAAPVLAIGTSFGPIVLRAAVQSPRLDGFPLAPLMLCGAVSLGASIVAPIGVVALFGEEFRPAVTIAMILALSNGALAAAVVMVHGIRGYGRPLLASVSDVFNLVCGLAVVPAVDRVCRPHRCRVWRGGQLLRNRRRRVDSAQTRFPHSCEFVMSAGPLISILTPAYNAAAFLGELSASVRQQTLQSYEHLIVDDGSTDAGCTAQVIADLQTSGGTGARTADSIRRRTN